MFRQLTVLHLGRNRALAEISGLELHVQRLEQLPCGPEIAQLVNGRARRRAYGFRR
jgi:hypothetical protein